MRVCRLLVHVLNAFSILCSSLSYANVDSDIPIVDKVISRRARVQRRLDFIDFLGDEFPNDLYFSGGEDAIPGVFIVVLTKAVTKLVEYATQIAEEYEVDIPNYFPNVLNGFVINIADERIVKAIAYYENKVNFIAQDSRFTTDSNWGLGRIAQREVDMNGQYDVDVTGKGVTMYIMDSGVRADHEELKGRVRTGTNTIGGASGDCNGHGTHVAGTAGGMTVGVAPGVNIVDVKVTNCDGGTTGQALIQGIEWVEEDVRKRRTKPAVINMSISGGKHTGVNKAVSNLVDSTKIAFVVAAGNHGNDACKYSPASEDKAITVGATDSSDRMADYRGWGSNYGTCLDIYAPGVDIESASHRNSNEMVSKSGTSMASPHVAGAAALILEENREYDHWRIKRILSQWSTKNKVPNTLGSPNKMLYVGGLQRKPIDSTPSFPSGSTPSFPSGSTPSYPSYKIPWWVSDFESFEVASNQVPTISPYPTDNPTITTQPTKIRSYQYDRTPSKEQSLASSSHGGILTIVGLMIVSTTLSVFTL